MSKLEILIVDDEWNMRNLIRIYLTKNGFQAFEAPGGKEALQLLNSRAFDAVILDVMMPGMDGWEVCKQIRENSKVPILMLTARTETIDKVQGLNLGADDYLCKPFDSDEMIARLHAITRRSINSEISEDRQVKIVLDEMIIYPDGREIFINDQLVELTQKEFDLIYLFGRQPKRVFTREMLLEQCWGHYYEGDIRTVDTHVKNLREKVQKSGLTYNPIQTVWGVGYKLQERG